MTNTKRRIELELVSMIRSLRLKNFLQFAHGIRYIFAHFSSYISSPLCELFDILSNEVTGNCTVIAYCYKMNEYET